MLKVIKLKTNEKALAEGTQRDAIAPTLGTRKHVGISDCRLTIEDWRFDGGTDLQLPIADLKSAITREALAEELNERWGVISMSYSNTRQTSINGPS